MVRYCLGWTILTPPIAPDSPILVAFHDKSRLAFGLLIARQTEEAQWSPKYSYMIRLGTYDLRSTT